MLLNRLFCSPLFLFLSLLAFSQSASAQYKSLLEIGPIDGLTTRWHRAPERMAVPLGTTLQLKATAYHDAAIKWQGADEQPSEHSWQAKAERRFDSVGSHALTVSYRTESGTVTRERWTIEVHDIRPAEIQISSIRLGTDPVILDPNNLNASTFDYYKEGSIAALGEPRPGRFCTSTNRVVHLAVDVMPEAFAAMMEWRFSGEISKRLGQRQERTFRRGAHHIEAGPAAADRSVALDVYQVTITSHLSNSDTLPAGRDVTLTASTDPAGFEDQITWLASSKYGSCHPPMARGKDFTVRFDNTFGPHPQTGEPFQWLGVKADNATFNQDRKPGYVFYGFPHEAIGDAELELSDDRLSVSLPADGEAGLISHLGRSAGWSVHLDPGEMPAGSMLSSSIKGKINGTSMSTVATAQMRFTESATELKVDYSTLGGSVANVRLLDNQGKILEEFEMPNNEILVLRQAVKPEYCITFTCDVSDLFGNVTEITRVKCFFASTIESPSGQLTLNVSEIEIIGGNTNVPVEFIEQGEVRAQGLESFIVLSESVQVIANEPLYQARGPILFQPAEKNLAITTLTSLEPVGTDVLLDSRRGWNSELSIGNFSDYGSLILQSSEVHTSDPATTVSLEREGDGLILDADFTQDLSNPILRIFSDRDQWEEVPLSSEAHLTCDAGGDWWSQLKIAYRMDDEFNQIPFGYHGFFFTPSGGEELTVHLGSQTFSGVAFEVIGASSQEGPPQQLSLLFSNLANIKLFPGPFDPVSYLPVLCYLPDVPFKEGRNDNFDVSDGIEGSKPRDALANYLLSIGPGIVNFDEMDNDFWFGHTIANLPGCLAGATLEIGLLEQVCGNETINLGFLDGTSTFVWSGNLASLNGGCVPGRLSVLKLNLTSLPLANGGTLNIMKYVNQKGYLDIAVGPNTFVDYLTLTFPGWSDCTSICPTKTALIAGGREDNFGLSDAPELADPRSGFSSYVGNGREFDEQVSNQFFGHTLNDLPGCILGAVLKIKLKARPDIPYNDTIQLGFIGSNSVPIFDWSRRIGTTGLIPGLLPSQWLNGSTTTLILDLSKLPNANGTTTNLIGRLNNDRFLDVFLEDDTGVDYMELTVTACKDCREGCLALTTSFSAGKADTFHPSGSELTTPSQGLSSFISPASSRSFDMPGVDRPFAHTFTDIPACVTGARLTMRLRAEPSHLSINDTISLGAFPGNYWSHLIGGLVNATWSSPRQRWLSLDLASLPNPTAGTTNLIPLIRSLGQLDIYIQDDTNVDFLKLEVESCEPCKTQTWCPSFQLPKPLAGYAATVAPDFSGQPSIYILGGYISNSAGTDEVHSYNPSTGLWTPRANLSSPRMRMAAATGPNGRIYAFGGLQGPNPIALVEEYDPLSNMWATKLSMPQPLALLAAATGLNGKIYLFGGDNPGPQATVYEYDPINDTYLPRMLMPTARSALAATTRQDGYIYVTGGNSLEIYDPISNSWKIGHPMSPPLNFHGSATGPFGRIYVFGNNGFCGPGVAMSFDPLTQNWDPISSMPSGGRNEFAAVALGNKIYVLGGYDKFPPGFYDAVDVYQP